MINYNSKMALITGASSGIGREFAFELAKRKCNLFLVARSKDKLEELANTLETKYHIKTFVLPIDLTERNAVELVWKEVNTRKISIDILVNNAGIGTLSAFDQIDLTRIMGEIQLNINALTELTRLFLDPMLKKQSGIIINVASMTAFQPSPYMAVYGATKAYVLSFTQALWSENKNKGIKILALCPGETKSSFHSASGSDHLKGNRMEPIEVVNAAFKALEKNRTYQVVGRLNYLTTLVARLLPRKIVINQAERIFNK